jgi:hypothetical protein
MRPIVLRPLLPIHRRCTSRTRPGWAWALGSISSLVIGCSSGGYQLGSDQPSPANDAAVVDAATDGARPADGGPPSDAATGDLAFAANSWSFDNKLFQGDMPSCLKVSNFWAALSRASSPYSNTIDVFFASRPTRDAVYLASSMPPSSLAADRATVVITADRLGSVEQWHTTDSGQVVVHVEGSALRVSVEGVVLRGAVSVPAGTANQPVSGSLFCP